MQSFVLWGRLFAPVPGIFLGPASIRAMGDITLGEIGYSWIILPIEVLECGHWEAS